jgi:hypothetical protein
MQSNNNIQKELRELRAKCTLSTDIPTGSPSAGRLQMPNYNSNTMNNYPLQNMKATLVSALTQLL